MGAYAELRRGRIWSKGMVFANIVILLVTFIVMVLSLTSMGFDLNIGYSVAVAPSGTSSTEFMKGYPLWVEKLFAGVSGTMALVSVMGIWALCCHNKSLLIFYSVFTFTLVSFMSFGFYEIAVFRSGGQNAGELVDQIESYAQHWEEQDTGDWIKTQDDFNCCGFELKYAYEHKTFQENGFPSLWTGNKCPNGNSSKLMDIFGELDVSWKANGKLDKYNRWKQTLKENTDSLRNIFGDDWGSNYFCKDVIVGSMGKNSSLLLAAAALLYVLQLGCMFSSLCISCCIKSGDYGMSDQPFSPFKKRLPYGPFEGEDESLTENTDREATADPSQVSIEMSNTYSSESQHELANE